MNKWELIQVSVWFLALILGTTGLGKIFTEFLSKKLGISKKAEIDSISMGVWLATGLTLWGYITLVLGVFGQFTKLNLSIFLLILLVISIRELWRIGMPKFKFNWKVVIPAALTFAMLATTYLSAMQPPHTSDELNYHFPQAQQIVDNKKIDVLFGGHYFYGNIPKQMEILFASGIALSGYALAHTIHFAYLIAFLLIVFGIIHRVYCASAAWWAVILILMYDDLTWNMTSGFVDGAAFTAEIAGLLLIFLSRLEKNKSQILVYAGLMFGIGASIKYSIFVTALFGLILLLPTLKANWKYVFVPALLISGFWYIKNLILFSNPFYPLYLGHRGVATTEYESLMANIQQFGPKSWLGFFAKLDYFKEIPRLPIFVAIYVSPILLFARKNRKFQVPLVVYTLLYLAYWYLLGTHQLRFIAPAIITALILLAITLSKINKFILTPLLIALSVYMMYTPYFNQSVWSYFWSTKLHLTERQYALGNLTQDEFMTRWYGCYYQSTKYLSLVDKPGLVVDNWSPQIEFNVPFFDKRNRYTEELTNSIDASFYLLNGVAKEKYLLRPDQYFTSTKQAKLSYEQKILTESKLLVKFDKCEIFKVETRKD